MARFKVRKEAHRKELLLHNFLPFEARELSVLTRRTPALVSMVAARDLRRARFERIAARKFAEGKWRRNQLRTKWIANIKRFYRRNGLLVQSGAVGRQPRMRKGDPNPWALYRATIKESGRDYDRHGYPTGRRKRRGVQILNRGALLQARAARTGKTVSTAYVQQSMSELMRSIVFSRGSKRQQFIKQYNNLANMIGEETI